ncbi:MAG TPA: tail fiber protein [Bryobacteraceae bacterium]|nr:tail fiber protein [Bryobacteraceae bacterium]
MGEIRAFAFGFVPEGWLLCDGSKKSIQQYTALYSLLGDNYGPTDNQTYFTLPNLLGQTPIGTGVTNGAPSVAATLSAGDALGAPTVTVSLAQVANHTHQVNGASASSTSGMTGTPTSNSLLSRAMSGNIAYYSMQNQNTPDSNMSVAMVQNTGGGQPHNNMQPYVPFYFCICVQGEYPPPQ